MTIRKRDDLPENMLYRVVCRREGTDDEWKTVSQYRRTYHPLRAARSIRGRVAAEHARGHLYTRDRERFEFAVQGAPVTGWEIV